MCREQSWGSLRQMAEMRGGWSCYRPTRDESPGQRKCSYQQRGVACSSVILDVDDPKPTSREAIGSSKTVLDSGITANPEARAIAV